LTLSYHELIRATCDDCGHSEEESNNPEISNLTFTEMEISFYWDLVQKGWKQVQDRDLHFCPECVKNPEGEYQEHMKEIKDEQTTKVTT
jgi:hypothetical protein